MSRGRPPVAVGLVAAAGKDLGQQVAARLHLLDVAQNQGYTLVQVLELGDRLRDSDVYAAALTVARGTAATAFLVLGDVDTARLRSPDLAAMRIITVPARPPRPHQSQQATAGTPTLASLLRGRARHRAPSNGEVMQ